MTNKDFFKRVGCIVLALFGVFFFILLLLFILFYIVIN